MKAPMDHHQESELINNVSFALVHWLHNDFMHSRTYRNHHEAKFEEFFK
jgi:hypothetical protein